MEESKDKGLSFFDYYKLNKMIASDNDKPTEQITQFDNKTITYKDAYVLLSSLTKELTTYTDAYGDIAISSINYLISTLLDNGIITKEQVLEISKATSNKWKNQ